ncbi:MAG: DNA polymerase III subunit beta, partial [Candidatus ainarchaeum sp.]|nr:DNA polymerase III subunit beta [Candidatus ainarchaeum sp.]
MALRDLLNEEENKKKQEGTKVKSSGLQSLIEKASALPEQKNQVEVPSTIKIKETPKIEEIKTEGFFDKVGSFIRKIATSVGNYYSEQDRKRDEMQFKSPTYQIMYGDARLTTDSKTGKKKITSPSLEAYKNAETEEEKLKIIKEAQDKTPAMQFLKSEVGKKITGTMAEATSNIPLKAIASIKAIGDDTYDEAYSALMKKRNDPNNNQFERIMYGLQDSGIQSAIGALLGVAVSIATRNPSAGRAVSMSYFAPISVEEERQSKGGDISLGNVLIDTVGDTIIGGIAESALKTFMKEGAEQTLKSFLTQVSKGFLVEGTTEPSQTFLKFANDYKNSHTEEEKQQVVNDLKEYVKNGGMIDEFLIGGLSGAGITAVSAGAGYISKGGGDIDVEPSLIPSKEGKTDVDVQPTTDSDFEIKGQLNSDFTTIRDEAVELTNEVESNPDNVEVIERLAIVNDQLRDYETAVKNRPVYISSESQEAPLATIETVKYPDGKVAVKISANAENQGMTLDFPQSKLYSSEEEAVIEAKESLISWANESLKSATTVKEIDFLNTIIEETQDFEKIKQETAKKIEETKKEKTKSLKQKDVVFPTFDQYYKETGGYKAVSQGMDTRGDYIKAVIDTLEGNKTDLGKISKERIEETREIIQNHSLNKERDLKRLEDAIKKSKGVEKGEEGIESRARESAKDLIRYNVEQGESIKSISAGQEGASTDEYSVEIGGYANGKKIGSNKIQVSRIGETELDPPIIFSLEEIYNEIKSEIAEKEPAKEEKGISFEEANEKELEESGVAIDTKEYIEDGGEFIKKGSDIVGWIQIDSDNVLRAIEIKSEYRGQGIATKVIKEKFGNNDFEARDLTESGKNLLKSIGTLKIKEGGAYNVIQEKSKKDIIFTGKEIAEEAKQIGTDQGFSDYTLDKIKEEDYKIKTVTISSLRKNDTDLNEYVKAGELREFEGEEFAMNPIVSSSGEVLDGYNRITQTFLDGETKIDVFYGIKKEVKKPAKKHVLPSKKKKVAKPTLLKKISEQQAVSRIVPKKPSMPLLGEVKVQNGKMYITDLEISLEMKTGLENGMYKLVGKEFIKTKSNPEDFPDVGKKITGDKIVDIETPLLFNEIKKANSFISKDTTGEVFTGITVKFTEDGMRIMSTDSFRLYLKDVPSKISKQEDFIIGNSKKLEKVLPIIGDKASISINENSIEFSGSDGRIIVNRIKGEFPDVAPIFPSQKIKATFNREEAIKVLKELTPYTDAIKKVTLLREKNKIVFLVDNKRDGIKKEFPLKATIENVNTKAKINNGALIMPIGRDISDEGESFNSEFLSSNIKAMEEETVNFFYSDYRQAGLITEGSNNIEEEAIEETFKKKEEKDIKTFLSNTQTIYDLRKYFKEEEVEVNFLKQVLMPDGGE